MLTATLVLALRAPPPRTIALDLAEPTQIIGIVPCTCSTQPRIPMRILTIATAVALSASAALAQNPPANNGPNNGAVNSSQGNNPGAPVAGANSFTEGQAKSRIEARGYTDVTDLKKDDKGVWHGKAMRGGKSVDVSLQRVPGGVNWDSQNGPEERI